MLVLLSSMQVALAASAFGASPATSRVQEHFKSDAYTVTWREAQTIDSAAELDIGDGSGHGFTLDWLRFRPCKCNVEVLSVKLRVGGSPWQSKWPPDRATVAVTHAQMKPDADAAIACASWPLWTRQNSAVQQDSMTGSSEDFWVYARLTAKKRALVNLNWAGYRNSYDEIKFAKPQAAVAVAREAVTRLDCGRAWPDGRRTGMGQARSLPTTGKG